MQPEAEVAKQDEWSTQLSLLLLESTAMMPEATYLTSADPDLCSSNKQSNSDQFTHTRCVTVVSYITGSICGSIYVTPVCVQLSVFLSWLILAAAWSHAV